eukprot:6492005-Amphidinium_carterae.1
MLTCNDKSETYVKKTSTSSTLYYGYDQRKYYDSGQLRALYQHKRWKKVQMIDMRTTTSTRIDFAVNNFVNICLHNIPSEYCQHEDQLHNQAFYLTVAHMTASSLKDLKDDLHDQQTRHATWFSRRDIDTQVQINSDKVARTTNNTINIGEFMEIRTTFKQAKTLLITLTGLTRLTSRPMTGE